MVSNNQANARSFILRVSLELNHCNETMEDMIIRRSFSSTVMFDLIRYTRGKWTNLRGVYKNASLAKICFCHSDHVNVKGNFKC